jgi:uncharacterized protein YegP (UPF0339 family)
MKKTKIEIYKDTAEEWRWTLKSSNGRIIADGAEGYATLNNCNRAVNRFLKLIDEGSSRIRRVYTRGNVQ